MNKLNYILILLALVVMASCGHEKVYRIGVSQCSSDDWRSKMNSEIEREAMFHNDLDVEIRSADDNSERQISDIRYFADNGFDIIIAAPNEAEALTPVIKEVYDRGIPVIVFDRDINGDSYTARIGVNNRGLGRMAGRYASQLVTPRCNVIEVQGLEGSTPAQERHDGFLEVADSIGSMNVLASCFADWHHGKAVALVDSLLRLYPSANLIYAHNDRMAIGASQAARSAGRDDIKIIGIDAAPNIGLKAVSDSVIDATFVYPTDGHRLIRRALDILQGRPYPRDEEIPLTSAVDLTNADILLQQNAALNEESAKIQMLKTQVDRFWQEHSSQTNLFYSTLVILFLLFVLVFVMMRAFWQNRRHQAALEEKNRMLAEERDKQKVLNEQLASATQSKLVFFTNVSHDLRTPLTLIADPVEQLAEADNLTPQQHTLMTIANKNVKILKRLINQVLDFRKYDSGKMELALTEIDFGRHASEWVQSFEAIAGKRHIKFSVDIPSGDDFSMALDVEKIERVVFNLLSNAFKYTPDNGAISFSCSCDGSLLTFSVTDTGIGISGNDIGKVFENFYQADKIHPNGSGIGLWLSRAFVEMHSGNISVDSEEGRGSRFTVTIPVAHVNGMEPEPASPKITENEIKAVHSVVDPGLSGADESDSLPLVLIIDDNADMRQLITSLLSSDYRVVRAVNGREGLRMAAKYVPDLIICDVMMPEMDGMECCRLIKEEVSTSHIPVLMLTACALEEQRVSGYNSGADGYLPKPFSTSVLKARCESLIKNRRRIHSLYKSSSHNMAAAESVSQMPAPKAAASPDTSAVSDIDSDFYNRFLTIAERELGNPDVGVDALASEMGLGRSQFYRKIKALTNYSPVELLRHLRLQRARQLLTTTDKSISEIAYETGFTTPAYFTKCFRDNFSLTPSELRQKLGARK